MTFFEPFSWPSAASRHSPSRPPLQVRHSSFSSQVFQSSLLRLISNTVVTQHRQFAVNNSLFNWGTMLTISATALIAVLVAFVNRIGVNDLPLYGFTFASFTWVAVCFSILRSIHLCSKIDRLSDLSKRLKRHMLVIGASLMLAPFFFWWDIAPLSGSLPAWVIGCHLALIIGHFLYYMSLLKPVNQDS